MASGSDKLGAIVIEGHVQGLGLTRSLGANGIPVVVVGTGACIARASKYCRGFFTCPHYLSPEFPRFLVDLCRRKGLDGWALFPTNDFAVRALAQNREVLTRYFKVITPGWEIVELMYNKKKTFEIAASVGVQFPKTVYPVVPELNGTQLKYPVILKGIEGLEFYKNQGKKTVLAPSEEELICLLQQQARRAALKNVMVQEVIPEAAGERVLSFTAFAIDGDVKAYWQGEKVREHPSRFGTATFCRSVHIPELLDLGSRLLGRLGYTGVCEVEFLKDPRDNQYKLLEINPRTWLWVGLARECGVDYAMMIYNYVHGIDQVYPTSYRVGVKWMHLWTDLAFSLQGLLTRRHRAGELVRSLGGEMCFAVLSARDPAPFVYETAMLPILALKR